MSSQSGEDLGLVQFSKGFSDPDTAKATQWILELYDSDAKLFTKEMLDAIEDGLEKNKPSVVLCINGGKQNFPVVTDKSTKNKGETANLTIQLLSFQTVLYNLAKSFQNNSQTWPGSGDNVTLTGYCCPANINYAPLRTKNIPFHTLRRRWEDIMSDWDETTIPIEIANIVKTYSDMPEVSKVVCLGLGSFSEQFGTDTGITVSDRNPIYRPMRRHAVAVSIAKAFTEYTRAKGKAITLYAQDPAYTENDKKLLREIGFQPVPGYGARGFGLIDDETVVFSCCPTAPVKQIVADLARPVAMIWERVQEEDPVFTKEQMAALSPGRNLDSPRTRRLIDDYEEHELSEDLELRNVAVYLRY